MGTSTRTFIRAAQEVEACEKYYFLDHVRYEDMNLPECGSDPTANCEGTVVKYCKSDDDDNQTFYQVSYDCTLAGATCVEWQTESGGRSANCKAPQLKCEGPEMPYCDGTRAVACEQNGGTLGPLSPWVYDCADAFGSHCFVHGENVSCEGPETGEEDCHDGKDGDGDGKVDCLDDDCGCREYDCDDGIDEDSDGKVDCDDEDCGDFPHCQ